MKKKFSKKWKESKQPRKQRKFLYNAPQHIKRKFLSATLSKELRKKYGIRSIPIRKNDVVIVMRGRFKNKKGKVLKVDYKKLKIEIEGIQIKKSDGSKVNVKIHPSNVKILELNLDDSRRVKKTIEEKNAS
ncbi:MAG: 50S ribosomal protein L24 [Candidatus Pacearchaeota archaeon]|nr:MAG: 50S ribosomal protein L24 [Candidatus Pacearchaeota archaeon]